MTDERGFTDSNTTASGYGVHSIESESGQHYINPNSTRQIKLHTIEQFELDVWSILEEAGQLLLKKHEAYGPKNISNAPGGPANGLRVRMWDKMARLNHILDNPGVDVNDESLDDTLIDLLNYSAIFLLVRKNQWPA